MNKYRKQRIITIVLAIALVAGFFLFRRFTQEGSRESELELVEGSSSREANSLTTSASSEIASSEESSLPSSSQGASSISSESESSSEGKGELPASASSAYSEKSQTISQPRAASSQGAAGSQGKTEAASGSGKASSAGESSTKVSQESKPRPEKTPLPSPEPKMLTFTVTVDCKVLLQENPDLSAEKRALVPKNGILAGPYRFRAKERASALDVLRKACRQKGIALDASNTSMGMYVRGIGGLYEFDGGPSSGWMYHVNGTTPNKSAGNYLLQDGDRVQWTYVTGY